MATPTPLTHPDAATQQAQYFRFRLSVVTISNTGAPRGVAGLSGLKAAYQPAMGAGADTFATEAPATDRVLLLGYYPGIAAKQDVLLTWPDGTTRKRFTVDDVTISDHGRTLLTVTPKG